MATHTTPLPTSSRPIDAAPTYKRKPPVKAWAVLGAVFLAFFAFVWIRWIAGPFFKRVPAGPTPRPEAMKIAQEIYIPIGVVGYLGVVYWVLIRTWIRERRVSSDGLLLLMWQVMWFQDPLVNWFVPHFTYNSALVNMGSWTSSIPGWQSPQRPGAMFVEPLLFAPLFYVYALFPMTVAMCWVMRKMQARFPNLGILGLIGFCWISLATFDLLFEVGWMRIGIFTYAGAIPSLTLFHGHYYQFPVYEAFLWGAGWTGFTCLRYFKNDKGQMLVERGIDEIKASPLAKGAMRFLALVGAGTVIFGCVYTVPLLFVTMKTDRWPNDIQKRSYLTDFLCGPQTDQACPSPDMPIARSHSVHFDPFGRVVVPKGAPPPGSETVKHFQR